PTDKGTGRGFARCSNSLSTSNERQTATRAPLGHVLGVSFLPTLAVPTACRICSSVESTVIGVTLPAGCGCAGGAGWALGELQPGSNPSRTSASADPGRVPEAMLRLLARRCSHRSAGADVGQFAVTVQRAYGSKRTRPLSSS